MDVGIFPCAFLYVLVMEDHGHVPSLISICTLIFIMGRQAAWARYLLSLL